MLRINNMQAHIHRSRITGMACLAMAGLMVGCQRSAPQAPTAQQVPQQVSHPAANTPSKILSKSGKILLDSMQHPKTPFHYSYTGQQNVNDRYAFDKSVKPQVAAVTLEADLSPDEVRITSMRGAKHEDRAAKKSDDLGWSEAQLSLIGNVTGPTMDIDLTASLAAPDGAEPVGGVAADKFKFDSSTLTPAQKSQFDIIKSIGHIKDMKVTAWVAKDSGELVKFSIDQSNADDRGNTWEEHYEGEVKPK